MDANKAQAIWDTLDGTKIISGHDPVDWNKQIRAAFANAVLADAHYDEVVDMLSKVSIELSINLQSDDKEAQRLVARAYDLSRKIRGK
jgi:hypothetical protein